MTCRLFGVLALMLVSFSVLAAEPEVSIVNHPKSQSNRRDDFFNFFIRTPSGIVLEGGTYTSQNNHLTIGREVSVLHTIMIMPDQSVDVSFSARPLKFGSVKDFFKATGSDPRANFPLDRLSLGTLLINTGKSSPTALRLLKEKLEAIQQEWKASLNLTNASFPRVDEYSVAIDKSGEIALLGTYHERIEGNEYGRYAEVSIRTGLKAFGATEPKISVAEVSRLLKLRQMTSEVYVQYSYYGPAKGTLTVQSRGSLYIIDWIKTYHQAGTLQVYEQTQDGTLVPLGYFKDETAGPLIDLVDRAVKNAAPKSCVEKLAGDVF